MPFYEADTYENHNCTFGYIASKPGLDWLRGKYACLINPESGCRCGSRFHLHANIDNADNSIDTDNAVNTDDTDNADWHNAGSEQPSRHHFGLHHRLRMAG